RLAESRQEAPVLLRHARHYVGACARWYDGSPARTRLLVDCDNLLSAHRRAVAASRAGEDVAPLAVRSALALLPLLRAKGPWVLAEAVLEAGADIARGSSIEPSLRIEALSALGAALAGQGLAVEAARCLEEALAEAEGQGDGTAAETVRAELAGALADL